MWVNRSIKKKNNNTTTTTTTTNKKIVIRTLLRWTTYKLTSLFLYTELPEIRSQASAGIARFERALHSNHARYTYHCSALMKWTSPLEYNKQMLVCMPENNAAINWWPESLLKAFWRTRELTYIIRKLLDRKRIERVSGQNFHLFWETHNCVQEFKEAFWNHARHIRSRNT